MTESNVVSGGVLSSSAAFEHQQSAHCESGVMSALLNHNGLPMSEAMVFGLSGAIIFAYLPMIKLGGLPLISYRMPPGYIVKRLAKRLDVGLCTQRFRSEQESIRALRDDLRKGQLVGLQTSIFWLPYMPEQMRFHFNAHNILVYGESEEGFQVSDPILEQVVTITADDLCKARFAKGPLAPKGLAYFPDSVPKDINIEKLIRRSVTRSSKMMLRSPVPLAGVAGIRKVSKIVRNFKSSDEQKGKHFVGHMIRMQEEIGTGGGGFRFLYAAFLQESGKKLHQRALLESAEQFTDLGDEWRRYALFVAKMIKGRMPLDFEKLADQLIKVADMEQDAWLSLRRFD